MHILIKYVYRKEGKEIYSEEYSKAVIRSLVNNPTTGINKKICVQQTVGILHFKGTIRKIN
jgi:hypothetical protein